MKKVKHKRPQDESFPVGKLVKKSLRPLVLAYYNAARSADDIADAQNLTREEKLAQLAETARAFHNKEAEGQFRAAADLGKLFEMENLANTLFLDLLTAFERDAENRQPEISRRESVDLPAGGNFVCSFADCQPHSGPERRRRQAAALLSACGDDEKTRCRKQRHISEFYDAAP